MATTPVITAINNDSGTIGDFITNDASLIISGTGVNGELIAIRYFPDDRATDALVGPFSNSHYADSSKWALVTGGIWSLDLSDSTAFTADPPPTITPTAITMVEGANTIYAYAFDGSWSSPSRLVITLDTLAPSFTFTGISLDSGVSATDLITNDTTLTWSGTMSEAGTLLIEHRLLPGGPWATFASALPSPAGPGSIGPTLPLSDGVREFRITPTDIAGNTGSAVTFTVTTDTTAPSFTFTGISIDSGLSATDLITNDTTLTWSGTMSEAGTLLIEHQLVGFGWTTFAAALPSPAGAGSIGPSLPLSDGVRNFRITPTDIAGNTGTAVTFTVTTDTQAPTAPVLSAITTDTNTPADFITTDQTLIFTGTAEAGSFVQVTRIGLGVIASGYADGAGNFALASGTLPFAEMMITLTATDLAGNASAPTAPQQLVIFPGNITIAPTEAQYFQTFNGGWGDDVIYIGPPSTHNAAHGMYGDDWIGLNGYYNTITGGAGNDTISGGQGFADINGGTGHDWITASGFLNTIIGGEGNDTIYGGDGYLYLDGGNGDDAIVAGGNNNTIIGGAGNDSIWGGQGNTTIDGGAGNNVIYLDGWNNVLTLGDGNNLIQDLDGQGVITAGNGNNVVALLGWNNSLTLGHGNNHVMVAWGGNTTITTGNGNNVIELSGWNNLVNTGNGNDNIWAGMGMSTINSGGGHDHVWLGASGASRADLGAGNDVVFTGGAWADTLIGGLGDDQFVLVNGSTIIIENPAEGIDTVWVNFSGYTMAENVEFGRIYGNNNITLTGNGLGNSMVAFGSGSVLDGQGGDDGLWGTSDADVFKGGLGNDAMYSGGGMDRYIYDAAAWGHDGIAGWVAGQKLDFTGSGLTFADLAIASGGGNSMVTYGASTIMVFGAASLTIGDFVFG